MKLKGVDKFRSKLPALAGWRILLLFVYPVIILAILIPAMYYFYTVPLFIFPLIGVIIFELFGFTAVFQMWYWRDKMKAKFPRTCYQRMFFIGFMGIETLIFLAFNSFFPLTHLQPESWINPPNLLLVTPLTSFIGVNWPAFDILRAILGGFCLLIGIWTIFRSLFTFGFDYMTVVYLYFPEESRMHKNEIYSILRHPTYAGVIYICLGAFFFYFSLFNLIYFIIYLIGFKFHTHFVEEKELINRFGDSYKEYRKSVPAFFVHLKNLGKFYRFLFGIKP
jgi:protein-S-isoprenylcysteine O-methyltransferase Ste14